MDLPNLIEFYRQKYSSLEHAIDVFWQARAVYADVMTRLGEIERDWILVKDIKTDERCQFQTSYADSSMGIFTFQRKPLTGPLVAAQPLSNYTSPNIRFHY
jgi:hypothetical protein